MSLYAEYVKEKTGDNIIEDGRSFITYRYLNAGKTIFVVDLFVHPDFRKTDIAPCLVREVIKEAKSKGATELLSAVVPSLKEGTKSLKFQLGMGMKLLSSAHDVILLRKDI